MNDTLFVRIHSITYEAQGINSYEFRAPAGGDLPPFSAGSHIDLHLSNGLIRSYSLCNSQDERHRYVVAINKDQASRGGSKLVHETLRVGDTLPISPPRNNFALAEEAPLSVFVAGGIGITPLWCMIQRLEALGRPWHLHYGTRTRLAAAFLERLNALKGKVETRLHVNFDQESGGKMLDIGGVVSAAPADAHLYCCGPLPMMDIFEKAAAARDPKTVHVEYFAAKQAPAAAGGFTVELRKSGKTLTILPGKTILDAVLDAGIAAPYSCMEGVCASCETPVIEGIPDHRDLVLSKEERAANKVMMICCSGSKTDKLVLDL
jgi:vanillate O-demethylase ferredoxin subunit